MHVEELTKHGLPKQIPGLLIKRGIRELNALQVQAIERGLLAGKNLVICAPTSSGKTLLGELVAARNAAHGLTVHLVSHKALAREVFATFRDRYVVGKVPYMRAALVTGDEDTADGEWGRFNAVVTTYERFYAEIVRRPRFLSRIRAVVADEIQLVAEEMRGPAAELALARVAGSKPNRPQFVGLSATVPNGKDLAEWLDAELVSTSTRLPPLDHEIWMPGTRWVFSADRDDPTIEEHEVDEVESVQALVPQLLREQRGPVAVMATERRYALQYARELAETRPLVEDFPRSILDQFRAMGVNTELTNQLAGYLSRRIGVHFADLPVAQRNVVEEAFRHGHLDVLVATPTLVAGVNSEQPFAVLELPSVISAAGTADSARLAEFAAEPLRVFNESRRRTLALYPGVQEGLERLDRLGVPIVAHTEAMHLNSYYRLVSLEIDRWFRHLYCLEGSFGAHPNPQRERRLRPPPEFIVQFPRTERKPSPSVIFDICAREGVSPSECVYIGDSIARDVTMAKEAGALAVWARYGTRYDHSHWRQLVSVTHWTVADVRREAELRERSTEVSPDLTVDRFDEVCALFGGALAAPPS